MENLILFRRFKLWIIFVFLLVSACTFTKRYVFLNLPDVYDYKKLPVREISNEGSAKFDFKMAGNFDVNSLTPIVLNGKTITDIRSFIGHSGTTAFSIIRNDSILFEEYYNGHNHQTYCKSFSVSKVFVSAMIGIAIQEGYIKSMDDPVIKYIPEIKDKRFSGLTVRHCLLLQSGIKTNNREIFPWNDKVQLYYSKNIRKLVSMIKYAKEPGKSFDIEEFSPVILGFVLERATGKTISDYLSEKIWSQIGMEEKALWVTDKKKNGFEAANSGLTALPIDFAKFGRLILNNGNWNGRQLIPESWVYSTTKPDTTLISFYRNNDYYKRDNYFNSMWWGFRKEYRFYEFSANGHFGQRIYVVPYKNTIIVRFGTKSGNIDWSKFIMKLVDKL